jgi:hypothetical protein
MCVNDGTITKLTTFTKDNCSGKRIAVEFKNVFLVRIYNKNIYMKKKVLLISSITVLMNIYVHAQNRIFSGHGRLVVYLRRYDR